MTKESKERMKAEFPEDLKLFVNVDQCVEGSIGALGRISMTPGAKGHGVQYFISKTAKGLLPEDFLAPFISLKYPPADIRTSDR